MDNKSLGSRKLDKDDDNSSIVQDKTPQLPHKRLLAKEKFKYLEGMSETGKATTRNHMNADFSVKRSEDTETNMTFGMIKN